MKVQSNRSQLRVTLRKTLRRPTAMPSSYRTLVRRQRKIAAITSWSLPQVHQIQELAENRRQLSHLRHRRQIRLELQPKHLTRWSTKQILLASSCLPWLQTRSKLQICQIVPLQQRRTTVARARARHKARVGLPSTRIIKLLRAAKALLKFKSKRLFWSHKHQSTPMQRLSNKALARMQEPIKKPSLQK